MIRLQNPANEQSTYPIVLSFFDEEGNATTPTALTWTLTDTHGNIRNSRENVVVTPLSITATIVLSGDDLTTNGARSELVLTTNATYTSTIGTNLPLREEIRFWVENLIKIGSGD